MQEHIRQLLASIGALGLALASLALLFLLLDRLPSVRSDISYDRLENNVAATSTPVTVSTTTPAASAASTTVKIATNSARHAEAKTPAQVPESENIAQHKDQIERIQNPYATVPISFELLNTNARAALVNIVCTSSTGSFNPTSGSGVIIDPRGIILTNAHVGQYILLSERPDIDLSCVARSGSPAKPRWNIEVVYLPNSWITAHAADITSAKPLGTGENDYALLRITGSTDNTALPPQIPFLPIDTREAIGFTSDEVLIAAYPAEFAGGIATQYGLYAASAITPIKELLTFTDHLVDVLSLGGVVVAQGGSSGGAVVNQWGYLIGLVTTTSEGETTGQRDLRAITLAHIDRSLQQHRGFGLTDLLARDLEAESRLFSSGEGPNLAQQLVDKLRK